MPNAAAPEDRERLNVNKERTARPGAGGAGTQRGAGETGCWETPQRTVQAPRPQGLALGCAHAACRCPSCPLPPSRLSGGLSGSAWGHRSGAEGPRSRQAAWPASFPADSGFRPRGNSRLGLRRTRSPSAATAPGLSMEGARLPPPAAPPLSAETCGVRRVTGLGGAELRAVAQPQASAGGAAYSRLPGVTAEAPPTAEASPRPATEG